MLPCGRRPSFVQGRGRKRGAAEKKKGPAAKGPFLRSGRGSGPPPGKGRDFFPVQFTFFLEKTVRFS